MRQCLFSFALACALAVYLAPSARAVESSLIHKLPSATHAYALTVGSDGAIWFEGGHGSSYEGSQKSFIGRLGPDGVLTEYFLPQEHSFGAFVAAPAGSIWFPEFGEQVEITHLSSSGQMQRYPLGLGIAGINSMTELHGDLWFAGTSLVKGERRGTIGRFAISTDGALQLFRLSRHCRPRAIAATEVAVWFGEICGRKSRSGQRTSIAKVNPAGSIVRRRVAKRNFPSVSAVGPDGTVWFGFLRDFYLVGARIARISPGGDLAEFRLPHASVWDSIAVGPERRLWFSSSFGGGLTRALNSIGTRGRVGKPICVSPGCSLGVYGLAAAPNGSVWLSAGGLRSLYGGGLTGMTETETIANEAGYVGWLTP